MGTVCNGDHIKGFVGKWEQQCLISFEGTSNIPSFVKDLEFFKTGAAWDGCPGCEVHSGFLDEYNSLSQCILSSLDSKGCGKGARIRTTGHSLGAAVNSIAMMDLTHHGWVIDESYDFGKPRVGDEKFAARHNELFSSKTWRVTHYKDPVPHLPPTDFLDIPWHFKHPEPEIYYAGTVPQGHVQCTVAEDYNCAGYWYDVPVDLLHIDDHLSYMDVDTGSAGCVGTIVQNVTVLDGQASEPVVTSVVI